MDRFSPWLAGLPTLPLQAGPAINIAGDSPASGGFSQAVGTVLILLAIIALCAAAFFGWRWFTTHVRDKNATPIRSPMLNRDTLRRIDQARAGGEYEVAGDLLSRAHQHADAGESYARAGSHVKAARSFQAAGNRAQAIHHFKQSGDIAQAARLYAEDSQHRAAAAEYTLAGEHELAAEQYARAQDDRRAAEHYEKAGKHQLAGKYYESAQLFLKSADNYERHLSTLLKEDQNPDELDAPTRELGSRVAGMLREGGELDRASAIFRKVGSYKDAADCLRSTGDYSRAAEMLIKANQPLLAASILEEAGEDQRAARMRGEAALQRGELAMAADELRRSGELERAAKLYEQVQKWPEAAALYEELERYDRAVELFVKSDKIGNAARCAEMGAQLARAAELYEQVGDFEGHLRMLRQLGDFFRASRLLFEHRLYDEALRLVEQIDSRDPLYLKSLELQGDILRSQNRHEKAYSRYRTALGSREPERSTIHLFYKMGRALEEAEDLQGALENYIYVTDVDEQYEDAGLRKKALQERQRRSRKTTSSGLISAKALSPEGTMRYEIVEEIARGGMGIVYKARDTVLGRIVAYKILGENLRDNETAVQYFLREARAAASLSHPNIVTIFDAGEQDGEYYMAMEFVEGTTLKDLIRRSGALPEDQVRYIMSTSCRALHYAHSKGLLHRDIKSGNVMVTRDKTIKIMDFGLAKFLKEYQNNHTQQVGTPFYMSPEQIIGKDIDFRSDLYSLGCMAFECATGSVPFFKGDLSYHHLHTKPPSPRSINPALSPHIEALILKLLEKDPNDRYQSAIDIARALA